MNKNINKEKNKFNIKKFGNVEVIFLVIITCIISLLMGYTICNKKHSKNNDKNLDELINTYNEIKEKYYEKIDDEQLLNGAVNGMLSSLDKYSMLIDKEENENFYLTLEGSYDGIGIEITKSEDKIIIIGVIQNSPAELAGIKAGDIILKVDDMETTGKETSEISNYIRNNKKDNYKILVNRNDEEMSFNLKKENVIIKSVSSKTIKRDNKKIGYIYLSIFSNATTKQFIDTLNNLNNENVDAIIIDVRENTGGHLTTLINILSELISKEKIIYQTEKDKTISKQYSLGNKDFDKQIVILQNSNSASAAELLSISLKENLNAIIVGEKSYGKGTVQEYSYLSNGNMYKYTTKKWLSPKGNSIDKTGVAPDIEVSLNDEYYENPTDENDNQLQTAIDVIINN